MKAYTIGKKEFLNSENWYGSYYELAIEYHPTGNDDRLLKAIKALWSQPELTGPWQDKEHWGKEPEPIFCPDLDTITAWLGTLTLNQATSMGCSGTVIRETSLDGSDWLLLNLPTGMLELVTDVQYPLESRTNPWIQLIDQFFLKCAVSIYNSSPFDLAIIGEEVSGYTNAKEITAEEALRGSYILPNKLADTLGVTNRSEAVSENLLWFPPNW